MSYERYKLLDNNSFIVKKEIVSRFGIDAGISEAGKVGVPVQWRSIEEDLKEYSRKN